MPASRLRQNLRKLARREQEQKKKTTERQRIRRILDAMPKASVTGTSKVSLRTRDYIGIHYDNGQTTLRRRFSKVKGKANVKAHKRRRTSVRVR